MKKETPETHIIAIRSIKIIRFSKRDVWVGDDTSIMVVIEAGDMRKQTVKDKDVTFLRHDRREPLAVLDVTANITRGQGGLESFRMVIQMFDDT